MAIETRQLRPLFWPEQKYSHFLNPGFEYSQDPVIITNDHLLKFTMSSLSYHIREFKIRRLRTTATDKHATAHDQNHVTVHFSRVALRLR